MAEGQAPESIRSARFDLNPWSVDDAPALRVAIDESLEELLPWIPFAREEPTTMEELHSRLAGYEEDFIAGGDMLYVIRDAATQHLVGGIGFYRRVGAGALEIGYWIRSGRTGQGIATEVAEALTGVGLALDGVDRLEIHVDPANWASVRIPRKLGYRHRETVEWTPPGEEPRRTMIWERRAAASALPSAP